MYIYIYMYRIGGIGSKSLACQWLNLHGMSGSVGWKSHEAAASSSEAANSGLEHPSRAEIMPGADLGPTSLEIEELKIHWKTERFHTYPALGQSLRTFQHSTLLLGK